MVLNFAVAPCSWGIENTDNKDNPPWETVLDEAGKSGFAGIELGPYGYLPTEASLLSDLLEIRNLELVAGTIYDDLTGEADLSALKNKTRNICSLLSEVKAENQGGFIVIIDSVKPERNNTAGHSEAAQRMKAGDWNKMMDNIRAISTIAASEFGIRPVVHPHAGGFIEFKDETEALLNDIPSEVAGLCLDTGHLYYAGDDYAESLRNFSSRLDYVHFKDINGTVYRKALEEHVGFFDACCEGVMCSIGAGCIDYRAVFNVLEETGYKGWITIEQERDPAKSGGTLNDLKDSRSYLKKIIKNLKK